MRILLLLGFTGGLLAQDWRTATELPGVDFSGLTPAQTAAVLRVLRQQDCFCGCSMKAAECRVKDPACGVSRRLASEAVKAFRTGRSEAEVARQIAELAADGTPPPPLEAPVALSTSGDPARGPAAAKVTIVEFSDFQCPYCAAATTRLNALLAAYPNDLRLVFKQFPLDIHDQARLAAQASLAAAEQNRFWELHDKMFANFRRLSRPNIMAWARESGLDIVRFANDLDKPAYTARIDAAIREGAAVGVAGTPTLFFNGMKYNGPIEVELLKPVIEAQLR